MFRSVKITQNADPEKYSYSRYGTGFDSISRFSILDFSCSENVIIFGVDMNSYVFILIIKVKIS